MILSLSKVGDYFRSKRHSPAERKLVRKIDFFILTFCCLSYFLNYVSPFRVICPILVGLH